MAIKTFNHEETKRKVAFYDRMPSLNQMSESELEKRKDWVDEVTSNHQEWNITNRYVDIGVAGASMLKRPQFLQMIKDAELGMFDLIVTREVSRFARNTVDTLNYTRELKNIGVEVYFVNNDISTFDNEGMQRINIMAALPYNESR